MADVLVLPGFYGETLELIESYAHQLHLVRVFQLAPARSPLG